MTELTTSRLDLRRPYVDEPGPRPIRRNAVLRVEDLRVSFGGRPAVDDVSFSVDRGEVLALVGESGSGKTVTALSVLGLLPRSATAGGSIQLTDDPAARPAHRQPNLLGAPEQAWHGVRGRLASMVFQEPQTALNPVRTVGWQLAEALRAHGRIGRSAARQRVVELLRQVGISDPERRAGSYPHQLSGGQKQRVVIALALAGEPALLIADEPTTALDVTVQAEILALLDDLRHRLGTAVLLITHNMGVVADLADRVLVMRDARMVERGEVVSLFSDPFTDYTRDLLAAVPRLHGPAASSSPHQRGSAPAAAGADPRTWGERSAVGPGREVGTGSRVGAGSRAGAGSRVGTGSGVGTGSRVGAALSFTDVVVAYPGRLGRPGFRALDQVTLELPAGRVLGVVGESGSGKTTVARTAAGNLPIAHGQVLLGGRELAAMGAAELRRQRALIGVVHQDPAATLDPLLTVGESIAEPLIVHNAAKGSELRSRVRGLLAEVSLPADFERRRPHELSGGQRQRVALARALALRPDLLIADEPTSALDVTVQARILKLFAELQAAHGFACLFISHDLAVVNEVSDSVVVLRRGRIVESGATADVLRNPQQTYTRQLVAALPVPDPLEQRIRRSR